MSPQNTIIHQDSTTETATNNHNIIDHIFSPNKFHFDYTQSILNIISNYMTQIPLLVKEKVQYYLQEYYRKEWSKQMEKVYDDIAKKIWIREDYLGSYMEYRKNYNIILHIELNTYYNLIEIDNNIITYYGHTLRPYIRTFLYPQDLTDSSDSESESEEHLDNTYRAELPKRYYYSSGLNHINGQIISILLITSNPHYALVILPHHPQLYDPNSITGQREGTILLLSTRMVSKYKNVA